MVESRRESQRLSHTETVDFRLLVFEPDVVEEHPGTLEVRSRRAPRQCFDPPGRWQVAGDVEDPLKDDREAPGSEERLEQLSHWHAVPLKESMARASSERAAGLWRNRSTPSNSASRSASGVAYAVRTITRDRRERSRMNEMIVNPPVCCSGERRKSVIKIGRAHV